MCPENHYWPWQCQQCDTAWNALYFACGIYGHRYGRHDTCIHCEAYKPNHPEDVL